MKITKYEKIKSLSLDEMVDEIRFTGCDFCPVGRYVDCNVIYPPEMHCQEKVKSWLESEAD